MPIAMSRTVNTTTGITSAALEMDNGSWNTTGTPMNINPRPASLASKVNKAELKANNTTVVQCLIGFQVGSIILAFLVASPLIFRHIKTGRFKKGWILDKNKAAPTSSAEVSIIPRSVNRGSDIPIGHKPSSFQVKFRQIYATVCLKTLPRTQVTVGRFLLLTIILHALVFGLLYKNTTNPLENFKRPGWVAAIFLPLQFMLAMKNSPLSLIGQSYERVNYIHRFIGRAMYLLSLIHGLLWWRRRTLANMPLGFKGASLYGLVALVSLAIISLSSIKWVRRKMYQSFLVCHIFGFVALLVALWMHVPKLQPIVALSMSFVVMDYFLVFMKTSLRSAVFTSLPSGLTKVEVDRLGEGWRAGQHVYLRVFKGRHSFEKHPFTIANAPASLSPSGKNTLLLMVKASGNYTRRIHRVGYAEAALVGGDLENRKASVDEKHIQALCEAASDCRLAVAIEGPYGASYLDMCDHETVVLVAGGSGFTYCMSTLEHIIGNSMKSVGFTKKIFVIWTLRDLEMVQVFARALNKTLECAQQLRLEVVVRLYVTTPLKHGDMNPVPNARITPSRVDLKVVLSEALESTCWSIDARGETQGCGVAVGVCGPEGLTASARDAVSSADHTLAAKAGGVQLHS
ncbi:hypothetical protein PSTT_11932 [Puccinia striiformis]|uniref:ferric-chelate reductase (NADPH) n=1 Tax=Puccinia striiformis TaxID=27350 RepID=A0A2S4UYB0_9BASI|nr:hypothetical protein PSTT_11932 [Puccinia striiformis]